MFIPEFQAMVNNESYLPKQMFKVDKIGPSSTTHLLASSLAIGEYNISY
jgi:hypothetical protein